MNKEQAIIETVKIMLSTDFNNNDSAIVNLKLYTLDVLREKHLDVVLKRPTTQFRPLVQKVTVGGIRYIVEVDEKDIMGTPFYVITDFAIQLINLQDTVPAHRIVAQRYLFLVYIHLLTKGDSKFISHDVLASIVQKLGMNVQDTLLDALSSGLVNIFNCVSGDIDAFAITEIGLSTLHGTYEQLLAGYNTFPTLEELMNKEGNKMKNDTQTTLDIEDLQETLASECTPEKLKPNAYEITVEQVEECDSSTLLHRLADALINEHNLIGGETAEVVVRGVDYTIRVEVEYNQ